MITAIDQDKGRPRGIGYTIVSGKSRGDAVGRPAGMEELALQQVFVEPVPGKSYLAKFLFDCTACSFDSASLITVAYCCN